MHLSKEDEEADITITATKDQQSSQGMQAARIRFPPSRMPFTTRMLRFFSEGLVTLNATLAKDTTVRSASEWDEEHQQLVIYIAKPGGHTHKLLHREGKA